MRMCMWQIIYLFIKYVCYVLVSFLYFLLDGNIFNVCITI